MNNRMQNTSRNSSNNRSSYDNIYDDNIYDDYEVMYDPNVAEAERSSKDAKFARPKAKKKATKSVVAELSNEADARDGVFTTTYVPARFEAGWLRDSTRAGSGDDVTLGIL